MYIYFCDNRFKNYQFLAVREAPAFFIFCERFFVKIISFWALVCKSNCFYSQEI